MYVYTQRFTRWLQARRVVFGRYRYNNPPPTRAKHEPTLEACCCCFFLRRVFKMSDGPILVRLRRNQSGSQWGFTMQGGYDQGSCLYIQKVRNRVYTSYSFGNTIFVHIGESDLVLFHQQRVQGHN